MSERVRNVMNERVRQSDAEELVRLYQAIQDLDVVQEELDHLSMREHDSSMRLCRLEVSPDQSYPISISEMRRYLNEQGLMLLGKIEDKTQQIKKYI